MRLVMHEVEPVASIPIGRGWAIFVQNKAGFRLHVKTIWTKDKDPAEVKSEALTFCSNLVEFMGLNPADVRPAIVEPLDG